LQIAQRKAGFIVKDYTEFVKDKFNKQLQHTPLGEPQIWLELKLGRSVEITLESAGLSEEDYYCSIRLHCSEVEFEEDKYANTMGIMKTVTAENLTNAASVLDGLLENYGEELCATSISSSNRRSSLCF